MTRAPGLGPIDYALLGLLRIMPRHGYELVGAFQRGSELGEALRVDRSNLYDSLKRLERQGLVAPNVESVGVRPARHVYHLTHVGNAEFGRWLVEPVQHNRDIRLDFVLKLFFVARLAPATAQDLLGRQLVAAIEQVDRLQRELQGLPRGSFAWVLRQMRLSAVRGTIEWLDQVRDAWSGEMSAAG
jgi:PadR family transcriptional regulator, regulatory protein AphA